MEVRIEASSDQATRNQSRGVNIIVEMLTGTGALQNVQNQLNYTLQVYQQIHIYATKAWRSLPTKGGKTTGISRIRQGPDELYADFVAHLFQATSRIIADPDTGNSLVTQLAFDNANKTCRDALCPYQKKGTVSDFIH